MTEQLDGPRRPPANGNRPKQLVVLLHGYGADGDDLIGLADYWSALLPDAAFVSPHAPFACGAAAWGREWFPLVQRDQASIAAGIALAAPILDSFLDAELDRSGVRPEALALVGFSQGAMMALDIGPARPGPIAGILSYSGLIARPVRPAYPGRPPVFLFHGSEDQLIPPTALGRAEQALAEAGLPVEAHLQRALGHGIDQEGLKRGGRFLANVLAPAVNG
ncbi:MAG: alpha/beta hydrolase [Bauldia sp.]